MTPSSPATDRPSLARRLAAHGLVRGVLAVLATVVPLVAVMAASESLFDKPARLAWPECLAAIACIAGYAAYVRRIERRPVTEFALPPAARELPGGVLLGALLCLLCLGPLAALGAYRIDGATDAGRYVAQSAATMLLVSCFEEVLMRAILFRLVERAWGSRIALAVSAVIFVAGHVPNDHFDPVAALNTALAGTLFAAAFMATRRMWVPIGMHFAWNFLLDAVFSVPVSGMPPQGWLRGTMTGPDWLTGGGYGVEASIVTTVVYGAACVITLGIAAKRGQVLGRG